MKRNLILSAILLMVSMMSFAQRLDITLEDNSIVSYDVSRIKSSCLSHCPDKSAATGIWDGKSRVQPLPKNMVRKNGFSTELS